MLLNVVAWACLSFVGHVAKAQIPAQCNLFGQPTEEQSGTNNYFIDALGGILPFPFAINVCTNTDLVNPQYFMYTCSQDNNGMWWVTKTPYKDSQCMTAESGAVKFPQGAPAGTPTYFQCDGQNTYVSLNLALGDPTCTTAATIMAGLGGCISLAPTLPGVVTNLYCDSDMALANIFLAGVPAPVPGALGNGAEYMGNQTSTYIPSSSMAPSSVVYGMCDPRLFCTVWQFAGKCGPVTQLVLGGTPYVVYGLMNLCELNPSTGTTTSAVATTKSSLRVQFALSNILLALVVPLFWLL